MLVVIACEQPDQTAANRQTTTSTATATPAPRAVPSASEEVALAGLNEEIDAMTRRFKVKKGFDLASNLVGSLLLREKFYGASEDLAEAQRVAKVMLAHKPAHPAAMLLRAEAHHAVKEYRESRELIDKARARLPPGSFPERYRHQMLGRALDLELSNAIETNRSVDKAVERLEEIMAVGPSYGHANKLANAYAKLGRFDKADELYAGAVTAKGEVTPFLLAWVAYERGRMWSAQAKRPERGRPYLEEALRYLPGFVAARAELNRISR